jgi:hypothetical protein
MAALGSILVYVNWLNVVIWHMESVRWKRGVVQRYTERIRVTDAIRRIKDYQTEKVEHVERIED